MRLVSDFDRIASNIAIWHSYDSAVKAERYSSCLLTSQTAYLVDPIPLHNEALDELVGSCRVAGIIITNCNHRRASAKFAEQFSVPVFAHREALTNNEPGKFSRVADGDKICEGLRVIGIEGAADGEIALHYLSDGGTFIIGDALINLEPYGFTFLPAKYCLKQKQMRRSLRKLLGYKTERILFAHGTPILSRASDRIKGLLDDLSDFACGA
jgi:glyoxylase-like metal-dependent hydrolase (beta-lactamase superfamily II)